MGASISSGLGRHALTPAIYALHGEIVRGPAIERDGGESHKLLEARMPNGL
jgi:hypothetical protein